MKKGMRIGRGNTLIHSAGGCVLFHWFTDCVIGSLLTVLFRERLKKIIKDCG